MSGGKGGGDQTQTSTSAPWEPAIPHLNAILGGAQGLYDADPMGANIVAPFSADQSAGFDATRGAAGAVGPFLGDAQGSVAGIMSGQANPWQEAVIDRVSGQAQLAANQQARAMGRQGSPAAVQNAVDLGISAIAPIAMQGHQAHIGNILSAAGMAPGIAKSQFIPAQELMNIGGVQQLQNQAQLDAPFTALNRYAGIAQRIGGMGGTSVGTVPGQSSIQSGLGGAAGGAQLGWQVGGPYGAAAGGVLGGLRGLLR